MSMLGEQIKELRETAFGIKGNLGRCLYRRKDVDEMQQVSGMLFEAADTIENLLGRSQADGGTLYGREVIEELEAKWKAESGTCELEPLSAIDVMLNMLNEIGWCKCSECGYATPDESNYCQNCGKKVKR